MRDWIARLDRAASTVQDIHGVLLAILEEACDERRISANPARGIPLPRRTGSDHVYLTHGQVRTLASEVSRHSEIIMLLAYSGIRWGELAALRPRDVDTDRNRIRIARSASKVNARSIIVEPKTWERRTVAVPSEVMGLLVPVIGKQRDPSGLIWARPDGEPMRPPTTTHWFTKAVARCVEASVPRSDDGEPVGLATFPRITAHELRHTAASLMIASGAHVKTVQRQLGHKSATMTLDTYGHLFDDDLGEVADRMGEGLRAAAAELAKENVQLSCNSRPM
ncbi:tyrosine-type recombinase/integrase [Tsukamurella sp. DT100]|uniref:tyrosine-type recombinase/integrase n=1 Tax=Tsukamurella sp. DT100 TaxID=3393415 RepID=UPI003CF4A37A